MGVGQNHRPPVRVTLPPVVRGVKPFLPAVDSFSESTTMGTVVGARPLRGLDEQQPGLRYATSTNVRRHDLPPELSLRKNAFGIGRQNHLLGLLGNVGAHDLAQLLGHVEE